MELSELRAIAEGAIVLDEAYYGASSVKDIYKALDSCVQRIKNDPTGIIIESPENKALENAIKKVFGFKTAKVYWNNGGALNIFGMLFRKELPLNLSTTGNTETLVNLTNIKRFTNHLKRNGKYYDYNHEYSFHCLLDQGLVSDAKLDTNEMMAIILHEIGHNFDDSIWNMVDAAFDLISLAVSVSKQLKGAAAFVAFATSVGINSLMQTDTSRDIISTMRSIDSYIRDLSPVYNKTVMTLRGFAFNIYRVINVLRLPKMLKVFGNSLNNIINKNLIKNYITLKHEQFADSFAANYGYGEYIGTALDKMSITPINSKIIQSNEHNAIVKCIKDLHYVVADLSDTIVFSHGPNITRQRVAIEAMKQDLKDKNLPNDLRAELTYKLDAAEKVYNDMMQFSTDDMKVLSAFYRKILGAFMDATSMVRINNYS